jgi:HEAT repeat protein
MTQDVAALVGRMPELDTKLEKDGKTAVVGKLTGIRWEEAAPIYDALLAGGRDAVAAIVGMIREVDDGADYKARYTLHGMAVYCCRPEKKAERAQFVEALAALLGGDFPKSVRGFLARTLQVVGDRSAVPALGKLLLDPDLHEYAAQALLAIRDGAVEPFREAVKTATGGLRLTIVQALGVLRDAASTEALRQAAGDADAHVRITAVWALANIGDAGSADLALKAADTQDWERIKAVHSCLLLAERLAAAGDKAGARRIYGHLVETRTDPKEKYVKESAERALAALG